MRSEQLVDPTPEPVELSTTSHRSGPISRRASRRPNDGVRRFSGRPGSALIGVGFAVALLVGCGSEGRVLSEPDTVYPDPNVTVPATELLADTVAPAQFQLTSSAIVPGGEIPPAYLCSTATVAPPLSWQPPPEGTAELAIIVWEQVETPRYYWLVSGIDPTLSQIGSLEVPEAASQAITDEGRPGWVGPCTLEGLVKEIRFTIHALSEPTNLAEGAPTQDAVAAILQRSIANSTFTATVTG